MSQRQAVTKAIATRYKRAGRMGKGVILDELCATTGWHRNHARKALTQALRPRLVRPRRPRPPTYGVEVVVALRFCWAVLGAPTGKRLAGYHRYDTPAELALLNELYALVRLQINFFSPQQHLVEKHRDDAKVTKRYDTARTPYQRILADDRIPTKIKTGLDRQYRQLNPAQLRRDILTLSDRLLELTKAKGRPTRGCPELRGTSVAAR